MRNLTIVTKNLLIINVLAFIATWVVKGVGIDLQSMCGLHFFLANDFHVYQLVTYMFLHANFAHILFNMFALWMFGRTLEMELGTKRFLIYYFVCGIGAALFQMAVGQIDISRLAAGSADYMMYMKIPTVGASGAVFGLLLAFGMMHPNAVIMLLIPPIPIKAKWFVVIYGAIELFFGISGRMDSIAHFAHLGGMFWGWLLLLWWRRRRRIFY